MSWAQATGRLLIAAVSIAALWDMQGRPAVAVKCVEPPTRDDAAATAQSEVVFVGTVVSVTEHGTVAQVDVEEIRKGPLQPATVTVQGVGPLSSGHRYFTPGERYVFYPRPLDEAGPGFNNQGGPFKEDACTPTRLLATAEDSHSREEAAPSDSPPPASVDPERSSTREPTTPERSAGPATSEGSRSPGLFLAALALPRGGLCLFLIRKKMKGDGSRT